MCHVDILIDNISTCYWDTPHYFLTNHLVAVILIDSGIDASISDGQ